MTPKTVFVSCFDQCITLTASNNRILPRIKQPVFCVRTENDKEVQYTFRIVHMQNGNLIIHKGLRAYYKTWTGLDWIGLLL